MLGVFLAAFCVDDRRLSQSPPEFLGLSHRPLQVGRVHGQAADITHAESEDPLADFGRGEPLHALIAGAGLDLVFVEMDELDLDPGHALGPGPGRAAALP